MTLRSLVTAAALVVTTGAGQAASAQTLCSAPIAPLCVSVETTYADPATTDRCRQNLDTYAAALDDYGACLDRQMEELRQDRRAMEESFACRAGGLEDCPDTDGML